MKIHNVGDSLMPSDLFLIINHTILISMGCKIVAQLLLWLNAYVVTAKSIPLNLSFLACIRKLQWRLY